MDNQTLHFSARFNGLAQELTIPMNFILGIYARENGQGMFFEPEDYPIEEASESSKIETVPDEEPNKSESSKPKKSKKEGSKRDNSHLKIIK